MLLNNFFEITEITDQDNQVNAIIKIDPYHRIFDGHFPGQPVVPGVCMLQMSKEILAFSQKTKLLLQKAGQIKYLELVIPEKDSYLDFNIQYKLSDEGYAVRVNMKRSEQLLFKFQGFLKLV